MAIAATSCPSWHTALMGSSPPCGGQAKLFSGRCPRLFCVPPRGRCALLHILRVEARANPRKESAKVRNRRMRRKCPNILNNVQGSRGLLAALNFNGTPTKPRLSVFCSTDQLYAMLIDDHNKKTIFYASTVQTSIRGDPPCTTIEAAQRVGEELIKACAELNISEISSYDRNGFARGERMQAFEIAIGEHGFLPR